MAPTHVVQGLPPPQQSGPPVKQGGGKGRAHEREEGEGARAWGERWADEEKRGRGHLGKDVRGGGEGA